MTAPPEPAPKPLLDRLGVKPGDRVGLVDYQDAGFMEQLADRGAVVDHAEAGDLDLLIYRVHQPADLLSLDVLRPRIRESGAIWVLRDKGATRTVSEVDVIQAARANDLVDNKIVSFSHTLAAMRLVVPLRSRRRQT